MKSPAFRFVLPDDDYCDVGAFRSDDQVCRALLTPRIDVYVALHWIERRHRHMMPEEWRLLVEWSTQADKDQGGRRQTRDRMIGHDQLMTMRVPELLMQTTIGSYTLHIGLDKERDLQVYVQTGPDPRSAWQVPDHCRG